jgi:hypothetical protein
MCTYIFCLCAFMPFNTNASYAPEKEVAPETEIDVTIKQVLELYNSILLIEGVLLEKFSSAHQVQRELAQEINNQIGTISITISDYKERRKEFSGSKELADYNFGKFIPTNIQPALQKAVGIIDHYLGRMTRADSGEICRAIGEELKHAKALTAKQWKMANPEPGTERKILPLKPRRPAPRPERPAPRPERPIEAVEPAPLQQKPESAAPQPESPKTWKRAAKEADIQAPNASDIQAQKALGGYYRRTRQITPAELKELAEQYKQVK